MNSPEITFQLLQQQELATKADNRQLTDEVGLHGMIASQPTHALVATTERMGPITVPGGKTAPTPTVGRASRINTTGVSRGLAGPETQDLKPRDGQLPFRATSR
jgi:hypothetical protein